jgi:hypothetical protein
MGAGGRIVGMVDIAIAIAAAFVTLAIAVLGVFVTLKTPATKTEKIGWLVAFSALTILDCCLVGWQTLRNGKQQDTLNASIISVRQDLQEQKTGREVDNAYLRAKLEDYQSLKELAPALLQMAQASENYTKKQYEVKMMSDAKLLDFTGGVITKARELGTKCKAQEASVFTSVPDAKSFTESQSMTPPQRMLWFNEQMQHQRTAWVENRVNCEQEYRQQIMGDAQYASRELLDKVGGDDFMLPQEKMGRSVIDGIYAGSDPIDESADYLEALANKLKKGGGVKRQ